MFTWNLQYVSKTRLSETLKQLMIESGKGDILVRIHTAIHKADEAVELARFIKDLVPGANIVGTSTSAIISGGKLIGDQCVISITQMSEGSIRCARIPVTDEAGIVPPSRLIEKVKQAVIGDDTKEMLIFFTEMYRDINHFVEESNTELLGVQMIGGVANKNDVISDKLKSGFVFDENGWSDSAVIVATFSGSKFECCGSFATGAQVAGEELVITKTEGNRILKVNGVKAAAAYRGVVGEEIDENPEISFLFPLVYSGEPDVPFMIGYNRDGLHANHNVAEGKKIKISFVYDRKTIADNHSMFNKIETFEKAETLFAYTCRDRFRMYPNTVMWELSLYENSNICGCLTEGEIACVDGVNVFTNNAFVACISGENEAVQQYNPYVFSYSKILVEDNKKLIEALTDIVSRFKGGNSVVTENLKAFIKDAELKLLYTEDENVLNEAALNMDMEIAGYDRVCLIDVLDTASMRSVFSDQTIELTYKNYISRCSIFAARNDYRMYLLNRWQIAIAAPSYMTSLMKFVKDMKALQNQLFETSEDQIAIVPVFCIINDCSVENLRSAYSIARLEMMQKNTQFHVCDEVEEEVDEETLRERYHMVNVINYALSHDGVVPYFQGIYDNNSEKIHHYEALMRLVDENGNIYYPENFLEVARTYGVLYDSMSIAMIKKVFDKFRDSKDNCVSINLSMRDIKNEDLTDYIYSFLSTASYPKNYIFEILENEDVDDYDLLVRFVDKIHSLGGSISIDDFGSGYSNLQHIASIHSDFIKIDGSIIKNCYSNKESERLVALISGWKDLSTREVRIVAEFVENEEIQGIIKQHGIDFSQGYFFSKPSPDIDNM